MSDKPLKPAAQRAAEYHQMLESRAERAPLQLGPANLNNAEYLRVSYVGYVDCGTTVEDILQPQYWAAHAVKLKPWDKIELRWEDGTQYAEAIVLDCSRTWAKVHIMLHETLTTPKTSLQQEERIAATQAMIALHEVKFRGPRLWSVVRRSDGAVLKEGVQQKDDATAWLREFAYQNAPVGQMEPVHDDTAGDI